MVFQANDKVLHFLAFFLLALLAFRVFISRSKASGFSLAYGAFLEGVQQGVPGRSASFIDWFTDAVGILAAAIIFCMTSVPQREY